MVQLKVGKSVADMIRLVQPSEQIIKPRLDKWLIEHGDEPFDEEIAEWVKRQIMAQERDRTRNFSSSSAGKCDRHQLLNYIGVPQPGTIDPQLQQIFQDGSWRHLRLQAQLAQSGIVPLSGLEFPLPWPAKRSMGTMDGVGTVPLWHPNPNWRGLEFGLELKGANSFVANAMMDPNKYINQVARYFLSGGFDLFTVFVESKNDQNSKEFVIERKDTQPWIDQQEEELDRLNRYVDLKALPSRLPDCEKRKGDLWKRACPYGGTETRPCAMFPVGVVDQKMFG